MHWDSIHVDVRNATVRVDSSPAPCQAALERMSRRAGFQRKPCPTCDIEEVLKNIAAKFRSMIEATEAREDGVRRIDKSVLRNMMDLAVGGPKLEGMQRNHINVRSV